LELPENPKVGAAPDDGVAGVVGVEDPVGRVKVDGHGGKDEGELGLVARLLGGEAPDARGDAAPAYTKPTLMRFARLGLKAARTYKEDICRLTTLTVPLSFALYVAVTHLPPNSKKAK
jgi:hypothetical protein